MIRGDAAPSSPRDPDREWAVRGLEPSYATFTSIPHYHGGIVRGLLLGAAAFLLVTSPMYADSISDQFPFLVFGAFMAVIAAAFTDPHKRFSLAADAVVAGVGMIAYSGWALMGYDSSDLLAFVLRAVVAIVFLFAFYFSLKTVRAFALHEVGRHDRFGEISNDDLAPR